MVSYGTAVLATYADAEVEKRRRFGNTGAMQKLKEVDEARAVMTEAVDWSVVHWLREKTRVRKLADRANETLDRACEQAKAGWSEELRAAYRDGTGDDGLRRAASQVKRADTDAHRARMEAEATFDEAEKQLSTRLAREGCRKAIHSWDLYEKAIRKAETIMQPERSQS